VVQQTTQPEASSDANGQDWKATLRLPPPDTRYQTAVWLLSSEFFCVGIMNIEDIE
jgi:hypothetical protein